MFHEPLSCCDEAQLRGSDIADHPRSALATDNLLQHTQIQGVIDWQEASTPREMSIILHVMVVTTTATSSRRNAGQQRALIAKVFRPLKPNFYL
jgi:hypothetical protein